MDSKPASITESPERWAAFCARHGQDPDDPDAFGVTPPNRLRRMIDDFQAEMAEVPFPCEDVRAGA